MRARLDLPRPAPQGRATSRAAGSPASASDFHRDVANTLDRLGADHVVEGATDDGLFRVDCLLADRRVAVEADGPSHYLADRAPNGPTRLRRRLLEARGLRVVSVPYFEWGPLATDAAKNAYLADRLPG